MNFPKNYGFNSSPLKIDGLWGNHWTHASATLSRGSVVSFKWRVHIIILLPSSSQKPSDFFFWKLLDNWWVQMKFSENRRIQWTRCTQSNGVSAEYKTVCSAPPFAVELWSQKSVKGCHGLNLIFIKTRFKMRSERIRQGAQSTAKRSLPSSLQCKVGRHHQDVSTARRRNVALKLPPCRHHHRISSGLLSFEVSHERELQTLLDKQTSFS